MLNELKKNELISIIMPVKDGTNYMYEAIEGIRKQNMNIEIIVVDDASGDNTAEIAQRMGCKVIINPANMGSTIARNIGLKAADGEFILFHDHDDVMNYNALRKMYDSFDADTQVVIAKVKDFFSPELTEVEKKKVSIKEDAYYGLLTGATLIRKGVFDIVGGFDESLKSVQGVELQMRFEKFSVKIKKIDVVATSRRIHSRNFGRTNQQQQLEDQLKILRSKLRGK